MAYTLHKLVNFGASYGGLAGTVGYQLFDHTNAPSGTRITAGIFESRAGSGTYCADVTIPAGFAGRIEWDTGGTVPLAWSESINPFEEVGALTKWRKGDVEAVNDQTPVQQVAGLSPNSNFTMSDNTYTSRTS